MFHDVCPIEDVTQEGVSPLGVYDGGVGFGKGVTIKHPYNVKLIHVRVFGGYDFVQHVLALDYLLVNSFDVILLEFVEGSPVFDLALRLQKLT